MAEMMKLPGPDNPVLSAPDDVWMEDYPSLEGVPKESDDASEHYEAKEDANSARKKGDIAQNRGWIR